MTPRSLAPICAMLVIALGNEVARAQSAAPSSPHANAALAAIAPLDDRVYEDIDALIAVGLIDRAIVDQRPFSRREVVRLLREAKSNLPRVDDATRAWAGRSISRDLARYSTARLTESLRADETVLREPPRPAPDAPTGSIDARIEPLAGYAGGRRLDQWNTLGLESRHLLGIGPHVAVSFSPRVSVIAPRPDRAAQARVDIREAAAGVSVGNLLVVAGRQDVLFGIAPTGSLVLSRNAPPLDAVRIGNDRPAALPSILRLLGPMRITLFVADLGRHQVFPHSQLVGGKISAEPFPSFEFSLHSFDEMGGRGSPPASFGDRVLDVLIVPDLFRMRSDFQFSNKFVGGDARWRLPGVRGVQVYGEGTLDDFDMRRARSSFLDDGGYLFGVSAICVGTAPCGEWRVRSEYHQTGIRYFTHTQFSTGYAENGFLLGDPLGPRGLGGYTTVTRSFADESELSFAGAFEARSGNTYGGVASPNDAAFHFVQVLHRPAEKRVRGLLTWRSARRSAFDVRASVGLERVTNWEFVGGARRINGLGQVLVEYRP